MKTIVFANPPMGGHERYGVFAGGGDFMPPLGLSYLAGTTRSRGLETHVLDCEILGLDIRSSVKNILAYAPDYVGITATTLSINRAAELAASLKGADEGLTTIIGGPHISALPEDTMMSFPQFDIGVVGEGEATIAGLVDSLENNGDLKDVAGLITRGAGGVHLTAKRRLVEDLDSLPLPAWDLLPPLVEYYRPPVFGFKDWPVASLITSRGCAGSCTFCSNDVFGREIRYHSAGYVIEMIEYLKGRYGIKDIIIYDDNFISSRKRLIEFCEQIISKQIKISWSCNARVDMVVDKDTLRLMHKAGCWMLCLGIESGSQKILNFINKRINLQKITEACALVKGAGIKVKGYFMLGAPLENKDTLQDTLNFIQRINIDVLTISYFTPMPGTLEYLRCAEYGYFDNDWKKLSQHRLVFVPKGLTRSDIEKTLRVAARNFYFRPKIALTYLKLMAHPRKFLRILKGFFALLRFILG